MADLMRMLGIARRAMNAHQAAMNVTGNNIANVNTEGYSRRSITLQEARSFNYGVGFLGSGVDVQQVERIRSSLVDQQLQSERPSFHQFDFKSDALGFIEEIFNEPSDFGLNQNINEFFNAYQELANDPESTASRTIVRQKGETMANTFNRMHRQLSAYQGQLNQELSATVSEVNRLTSEIAKLNEKVVGAEVNGMESPDLRDQRDMLIDKLSQLVDVRTFENQHGSVTVAVADRMIVVDTQAEKLTLKPQSDLEAGPQVVFARDNSAAAIKDGKIKGILSVRDEHIPSYLSQLDELAVNISEQVNAIHTSGYNLDDITGINFFSPTVSGADDFAVSVEIMNNANLIATSDAIGEPGNNSIALGIGSLHDEMTMNDSQFTFSDFYNSLISNVGSQTQEANLLKDSYDLTVERLELTRQSISGVSLNEEMTSMIESQTAFTAAARVVGTIDEMTQTVLGMV